MDAGDVIVGLIAVACFICLIYIIAGQPKRFDKQLRLLLVDYKRWVDRDDRHIHRSEKISNRQNELSGSGEDNLDYLRSERTRIKIELDQLEDLNSFLDILESEAEQRKYRQLKEIENKIDEHPDRERELEDTRSRLVARMEDISEHEADRGPDR